MMPMLAGLELRCSSPSSRAVSACHATRMRLTDSGELPTCKVAEFRNMCHCQVFRKKYSVAVLTS